MKRPACFSDIRSILANLPGPDTNTARRVAEREATLTKPAGSLGRLEGLVQWLAAWQGTAPPRLDAVLIVLFAGNHGVVAQGVSAFPASVTAQMVANFEARGAAINQLARSVGARLSVTALDLDRPTADFTAGAAMSEPECVTAFARGMASVEDGIDLLCVGEMGIGNTTAAAALAFALQGGQAGDWAGRGTGVDDAGLKRKIAALERARGLHGEDLTDPLEALRRVGGRELAALAGAVLSARLRRVPVLLDGYVTTASAAVLARLDAHALDHCRLGHVSAEPGHRRLAAALGLDPILDLGMRLGEGSGAALAAHVLKGAVATHAGMATFAEAGVSEKSR
jgi:nicotinate-nucleotide--dimethylbenzimidazole phosphoribosyltransferase